MHFSLIHLKLCFLSELRHLEVRHIGFSLELPKIARHFYCLIVRGDCVNRLKLPTCCTHLTYQELNLEKKYHFFQLVKLDHFVFDIFAFVYSNCWIR